jgi:hypothetical protein
MLLALAGMTSRALRRLHHATSRDAHHDGEIHGLPDPFWHARSSLSPRGKGTRLAIPAIFIGVLAIEVVAIGASLPAMLP